MINSLIHCSNVCMRLLEDPDSGMQRDKRTYQANCEHIGGRPVLASDPRFGRLVLRQDIDEFPFPVELFLWARHVSKS